MGKLRLHRRKTISIATYGLASLALIIAVGISTLGMLRAQALSACPCHLFTAGEIPSSPVVIDGTPIELGVRFKTQVNGYVTGVRFYKEAGMDDTHLGNLWGPTGNLLASATFINETSSGWQDVIFSSPVQITADTLYTASYYSPAGKYLADHNTFASDKNNYPLTAPSSPGNGVFAYGSDSYPTSSYQASNYWVDVTFRASPNGDAPQVNTTNPSNGSSGIVTGANLTATFSHAMDAASINTTTVTLVRGDNQSVSTTVTYNEKTDTATVTPSQPLAQNTAYTLTLHGGAGNITDLDGVPLATDSQTSFTTGTDTCPCSVWNNAAPSSDAITYENTSISSGETFGTTMTSDENGYIQAVRFFKPLKSRDASHTVRVWSTTGTLLGSGTSSHETAAGWQEVKLDAPVSVEQGKNYIVSFYASDTLHVYTDGGLAATVTNGPLHAVAHGAWFAEAGDVFPTQNDGGNADVNFWLDAVFTTSPSYAPPFRVSVSHPIVNDYGIKPTDPLTFTLSNAADTATVANSVSLKDASGASVTGSTSYSDTTRTLTFTPDTPLTRNQRYTATVSSNLQDIYGSSLAEYAAPFTVGTALSTDFTQGKSGPVLVITTSSDPYGTYLAEMLRTEGINYFTVKDISQLSPALLDQYHMVLLAKTTLSSTEVSALDAWVRSGGNLIAMQPDKQLASLLGLVDQNQTLGEGYLKVDASTVPGAGITTETMQYHGNADKYTAASGTKVIATLFSNDTTPTINPAITETTVGSGHAAAFTYNLPRSIALTHQGNPAWSSQERDGSSPIRPNDLFYGGSSTDWLNTAKAHIPQADEQQRVLINMILTMDAQNTPLPRFWILPNGLKAAVVMISDDHATSSATYDIFNDLVTVSPHDCSVVAWQCARGSSLLYTTSGLSPAQADLAQSLGFSMGVHVQTSCGDFGSYSDLSSSYSSQINGFTSKYTGITPQTFDRTHCYVWSDWDSVAKVDAANGLRINYNYEWYPPSWTGGNTGYLTGSGLSMRFTDASGNMIDTYQGVTDLDYETDPSATSMNTDFDNATNSNAYYGVFGTHYDTSGTNYYRLLIEAAQSHNIPLISASQLATWKDALNSSTFANVSSSASKLTFTVEVAEGGEGMQAMIPASSGNGALTKLEVNGSSVDYSTSLVKGVSYAIFGAEPGAYTATYGTPALQDDSSTGTTTPSSSPSSQTAPAKAARATSTIIGTNNPSTGDEHQAELDNQTPSITHKPSSTKQMQANTTKQTIFTVPLVISIASAVVLIGGGTWLVTVLRRHHKGM